MNRRNFIKNMAVTAGSVSPLLRVGGGLGLLSSVPSTLSASASFDDYKAIVIINLDGGNDAMNTFPPTYTDAHADYADIRRNLAVQNVDLSLSEYYKHDSKGHYKVEDGDGNGDKQPYWMNDGVEIGSEGNKEGQYIVGSYHTKDSAGNSTGLGIHAFMPEIAKLYDSGKLSLVSNAGTLIEPATKEQIEAGEKKIPLFLFSHLHQYKAVASLQSDRIGKTGWAGRLADKWKVNGSIGLNLSFTGGNFLFSGTETKGIGLSGAGVEKYHKDIHESPQESMEDYLISIDESAGEINNFKRVYNKRMGDSARLIQALNVPWKSAPDFTTFTSKNSYGKPLFDVGGDLGTFRANLGMRTHHGLDGYMFSKLADTAKMLKVSKDGLGHKRQIFNVSEAGYDFHGNQLEGHTKKMRALSLAVSDFYKALEEMGMEEEVLVILSSEFGRTMKSNADGTDHGWGGHSFMLCGDSAFNGGQVFGEVMTDLKLNGANAYTNRARIIPTTAIEQMMAPALKWFGVDEATMAHALPNLVNFRTNSTDPESAFLQGVFS